MKKFTILDLEQVFKDRRLGVFNTYGVKCSPTDFAILTGAYVYQFNHTKEGTNYRNRTCCWWLNNSYLGDVYTVDGNGNKAIQDVYENHFVVRPITTFSSVKNDIRNIRKDRFGTEIGEYGMYPNSLVEKRDSYKLEKIFKNNGLNMTGKVYKTDTKEFNEYKNHGNRFIRFVQDKDSYIKQLNDGTEIKKGNIYWLNVEPIEWLIDRKNDIIIAKNGLVSDVKFDTKPHYYGKFEDTNIKRFLDNNFSIVISSPKERIDQFNDEFINDNIYNYQYNNLKKISKKEKQRVLLDLLSSSDEKNDKKRQIAKQMGDEYLKIYDALKTYNSNTTIKRQSELKIYTKK